MKLRSLKVEDADGMLEWMHSEATKNIFAKDFSILTKEDVLEFIKNSTKNKSEIHYACVDDDDNYLGTISLKNIDYDNNNAELGISFIERAQGTGAARYALIELLKEAFLELGLKRVYLCVLETNERAIGFYNKLGFEKEGVFREHILKNGKQLDLLWYSILQKEFEENGKQKIKKY